MPCVLLTQLLAAGTAAPAQAQEQPPAVDLSVEAPASLAPAAGRVRRMDLGGFGGSLAAAGLAMPGRLDITLIPDSDPRASGSPPWIVGLAGGTSHVVIFPDRIGTYPHGSLESVVRHEIVHLALDGRAAGRPLPRWFHEGVATALESGWHTGDEVRLLLAALDPPSVADIHRLFASNAYPDTALAYRLSAALVNEIRDRHGPAVPGAIAAGVAEGASFERAFRAATGEDVEAAADRAWGGYRRISRWLLVATDPAAAWTLILALAAVAFVFRWRRRREQRRRWSSEDDDAGSEEGGMTQEPEEEGGGVRSARESEIDALAHIWHEGWHESHAALVPAELTQLRTVENFRDRLRAALPEIRVIGLPGAPIGFSVLKADELYQLFVSAPARGSGVAAALIADAEARLSARGVCTAWLACAIGNTRAARFYEKRGWRLGATILTHVETSAGAFPLEVWRYEKDLTGGTRAPHPDKLPRP